MVIINNPMDRIHSLLFMCLPSHQTAFSVRNITFLPKKKKTKKYNIPMFGTSLKKSFYYSFIFKNTIYTQLLNFLLRS